MGLGLMGLLISGLAGPLVESAFLSAATLGSPSCFLVYSSGFTIGSGISSFGFVSEGLAGVYGFINVVFYVLSDLSAAIGVIYGPVDFAVISFSLDSSVLLVGLAKSQFSFVQLIYFFQLSLYYSDSSSSLLLSYYSSSIFCIDFVSSSFFSIYILSYDLLSLSSYCDPAYVVIVSLSDPLSIF